METLLIWVFVLYVVVNLVKKSFFSFLIILNHEDRILDRTKICLMTCFIIVKKMKICSEKKCFLHFDVSKTV